MTRAVTYLSILIMPLVVMSCADEPFVLARSTLLSGITEVILSV
jgi:hypothetical protein